MLSQTTCVPSHTTSGHWPRNSSTGLAVRLPGSVDAVSATRSHPTSGRTTTPAPVPAVAIYCADPTNPGCACPACTFCIDAADDGVHVIQAAAYGSRDGWPVTGLPNLGGYCAGCHQRTTYRHADCAQRCHVGVIDSMTPCTCFGVGCPTCGFYGWIAVLSERDTAAAAVAA